MAPRTELESVQAVALMCADELAASVRSWLQALELCGDTKSEPYQLMSKKMAAYAEASMKVKLLEGQGRP